jgi:hypothetical protein
MEGEIAAGRAFVEVAVKDAVDRGLNSVASKLSGFSKTVAMIGGGLSAVGAMITAPLLAALPAYAESGKQLSLFAERTGMSVSMASQLKGALGETGSSLEGMEKGFLKLNKLMSEAAGGSKAAKDTFRQFGLSAAALAAAGPDQRLGMVADALSRIPDAGQRSAAAMQLLGRGGAELVPILSRGSAGIAALRAKAAALGEGATEGGVAKARATADAYSNFGRVWSSIPKAAAAAIAEPMTRWMNWLTGIGVGVKAFVKDHQDLIATAFRVGSAIGVVGAVLLSFTAAQKVATLLNNPLTRGIASLGASAVAFVTTNPIGIVGGLLIAGVAAWALWTDSGQSAVAKVKEAFGPMVSTVTDTVAGVKDALASGNFSLAAEIAGTGLKLGFLQALSGISTLLGDIMGPAGEQLKSLGSDALQGNWEAVVADLGGLWANFCGGIVKMMMDAVDKIAGLWADTVSSISNWLLEASAGGGVMGGVASAMLGVNMKDANAKDQLLKMQTQEKDRKLAAASIPEIQAKIAAAKASGDTDAVKANERFLAEQQSKAAGTAQYGGKSAMAGTRDSIDTQVAGWKSAVTDWTSDVRETAAAQAKAASDEADAAAESARAAKGTQGADEYTAGLSQKLKDLNAQAAAEKAAFESKIGAGGLGAQGEAGDPAGKLKWAAPSGTFSAYSLGQQFGATQGVEEKILAANEAQKQLMADGVAIWKEWFDAAKNSVGAVWGGLNIDGAS